MIPIKICGITNPDDARLAAELGAFAIGMVFWPRSPRRITVDAAREIVDALSASVQKVGVFVDQPAEEVHEVADQVGLTVVQLHGHEDAREYEREPGPRVMKAVALDTAEDADRAMALPGTVLALLDAHDPVKRGGTGRTIDWSLAARVSAARRVVLSGGLHAGNVREAIGVVHPFAIDVSSGVEQAPGRKDPEKLRALFAAVRAS